MKILIDTVNKTIEIEEATTKELKKLCKDYEGFKIISKVVWNSYPIYPYYPAYPSNPLEPIYVTSDSITTVDYSYQGTSTLMIN